MKPVKRARKVIVVTSVMLSFIFFLARRRHRPQ
jgi:hypothetical protein